MIAVFMILIAAGVFALVAYPIVRRGEEDDLDYLARSQQVTLQERKEAIYADIKNLEMDYRMGKLSQEDFLDLQRRLKAQAAHILEVMEGSGQLREIEDFIEAEVAALKRIEREEAAGEEERMFCLHCGAQYKKGERVCYRCGTYFTSKCPGCGKEYRVGDRFCIRCGVKL